MLIMGLIPSFGPHLQDMAKGGKYVKDVMTTPPIAAKPTNKVADAACLMLKASLTLWIQYCILSAMGLHMRVLTSSCSLFAAQGPPHPHR